MAAGKRSGSRRSPFRPLLRGAAAGVLILLGGVLFNLDRLDSVGIRMLRHRELLPPVVRRFLPGAGARESRAEPRETLTGRIIAVYDGDTATLLAPGGEKKYQIRFFGMDAPEAAQEYGSVSKEALSRMILGRDVRVEVMNVDLYGRAVGKVFLDDLYVNGAMVRGGHAWHYAAYAPDEADLAAAQQEARYERRGLWNGPPPQPPWEYRKEAKSQERSPQP